MAKNYVQNVTMDDVQMFLKEKRIDNVDQFTSCISDEFRHSKIYTVSIMTLSFLESPDTELHTLFTRYVLNALLISKTKSPATICHISGGSDNKIAPLPTEADLIVNEICNLRSLPDATRMVLLDKRHLLVDITNTIFELGKPGNVMKATLNKILDMYQVF